MRYRNETVVWSHGQIDLQNHSNDFEKTITYNRPLSYEPPPFPSLYWPFPVDGTQTNYLYDAYSMFRFTLIWTLICVIAVHFVAAGYAVVIQYKNWRIIWVVPIIYGLIGGIEALIAGSVVGGL